MKTFLNNIIDTQQARLVTIESSSKFIAAHRLYKKLGFSMSAKIDHYYNEHEHKHIYVKNL